MAGPMSASACQALGVAMSLQAAHLQLVVRSQVRRAQSRRLCVSVQHGQQLATR